jgi:hypothetical protein
MRVIYMGGFRTFVVFASWATLIINRKEGRKPNGKPQKKVGVVHIQHSVECLLFVRKYYNVQQKETVHLTIRPIANII